ncbi:hypothetical protein KIN20_011845, partial [Parelaphostrongylus tenuis]
MGRHSRGSVMISLLARNLDSPGLWSDACQVIDVLESDGQSALLPEAVISIILGQLTVNVTYQPMLCQAAILNRAADN